MMELTLKEIVMVVTILVVGMVITSQAPTVPGEFRERSCETETSDLGLEQCLGVCQALLALSDDGHSCLPSVFIPAHA